MSPVTRSPILQESLPRTEAAAYIGVEVSTLASWAHTGKHRDELPFAMIGKKAYYRKADLDRFVESRFAVSAQ
jgi:excisionase family DNA binding protein